jgi:hypothetical protein
VQPPLHPAGGLSQPFPPPRPPPAAAVLACNALDFGGFPHLALLFRSPRSFSLGGVAPSSLVQDRTERDRQFLDVGLKSRRRNLGPLPPRETLQALGQFARFGHGCAIDKDRNHANVAMKRRFDLDPDEIVGIVDPAQTVPVGAGNPVPSNDRDKRVTRANAFGQDAEPINAEVDVVDIEEDVFALQPLHETIVDCACGERGLFAPIANEHAARHADVLAPRGN